MKRVRIVADRVLGRSASTNTIERICLDVGDDLAIAEQQQWEGVIDGEVPIPSLAIVEFDGGRIRTRKTGCGPGVHLDAKDRNETKNAIFVSAVSTPSDIDPQPEPPHCFLDPDHVAKLAESTKTTETKASNDNSIDESSPAENAEHSSERDAHKLQRLLRTFLSSMSKSQDFGPQMRREAQRRRLDEAERKAFVGDGLPCNWTLQKNSFPRLRCDSRFRACRESSVLRLGGLLRQNGRGMGSVYRLDDSTVAKRRGFGDRRIEVPPAPPW